MRKRMLALLLVLVLVAGLLPTTAFAADAHDVTVYAAVEGVTFADASGAAVSAQACPRALWGISVELFAKENFYE